MTVRDWPSLNEVQLKVLKWVRDGADESTPPTETYKSTAVALAARDLIDLDRRKGHWRAVLTAGGSCYLEHGYFEGHPPVPKPEKPVAVDKPHQARPLKPAVEPESSPAVSKPLSTADPLPPNMQAEAAPTEIAVATDLRGAHPLVRAVVQAKRPDMPAEHRRRAHLLLHSLVHEAVHRGWAVTAPKQHTADLLSIDAGDRPVAIRLRLRTTRRAHEKTPKEIADEARRGYHWGPSYDYLTTDDMIPTLSGGTEYRDTARTKLEAKLRPILDRIAEESAQARELAERLRIQEEERARQREEAAQRRTLAQESDRWVTALDAFEATWRQHAERRIFLDELRASLDMVEEATRRDELQRFTAWAEGHVERTAPLVMHRLPDGQSPTEGFKEWAAGDHEDRKPDWSWMTRY